MDDTISRKAAIDELVKMLGYCFQADEEVIDAVVTTLKELPPAEPQIVRCKDCKHWIPYDWMFSEMWQSKNIADYPEDDIGCAWSDMAMKANDFCSRAERRTE